MAAAGETTDEKPIERDRAEPSLTLEWFTPEELEDNPRNWRTHPAAQRRALADVIAEVGWAGALLYNRRTRRLIDGHARKKVAKAGERMPVLIGEWTEEQELKILATLDPLSAMAGADDERLAEILKEVETSSDAVKRMLSNLARGAGIDLSGPESDVDAEPQIERAEELRKKWGTELGPLWILGDHRLLCGDSTNPADVQRLMDGQRAALFATDPPYLVDYDGTNHPGTKVSKNRESLNKDWSGTYRDFDRSEQGDGLYDGFISVAVEHAVRPDAGWYCWHASRRQAMVEAAWERHGAFVHQQIIWAKERPVLTRSWYLWQHEPCFFGWVKGKKPPRVAAASPLASVWTLESVSRSEDIDHPTPKPVECFAIPMRQHTEPGDLCYEPFCGSGSQVIAAEQTGRRCFAMELAPEFVAVSLQRYLDATGKKPVLAEQVAA